ncbi:hypothetical protein [Lacticaseibacillus paracasei]|uniref:hypothetical protein n=1 Tax=Lacticaseibacillus paracasei TaxID=1597 RepID=UPI000F0B0C09|nr:hypothetical protein [Lacticaseibacillus paracasei]RNE25092.1 hypothetical protein FAM6161_02827 [Lacticaseibacillus paracasei]
MKNKKEYLSLDTFSFLANLGWVLTFLKASGVITQLPWHTVLDYWLCLLAVSVILGSLSALIGLGFKGGDK